MIAFIYSCKKDGLEIEAVEETTSQINFSTPHPVLNDGMLKFESQEHSLAYINDLSVYLFDELGGVNIDERLLELENQLGYKSLRAKLYIDSIVPNRNDIEDFIVDDVVKSLLNEDYELQVGDEILVFQSKNKVVVIDANDSETRGILKNEAKGDDYVLGETILSSNILDVQSGKFVFGKRAKKPPFSECTLHVNYDLFSPTCSINEKLFEASSRMQVNNGNPLLIDSEWVVNWGDGSPLMYGTGSNILEGHTYPSSGDFSFSFTVTAIDACTGAFVTEAVQETISVYENDCSNTNASTGCLDDSNGDWNYKVTGALSYSYTTVFGSRIYAKTNSWHRHHPWTNFHRRRGNISVDLHYDFRNNVCSEVSSGDKSDSKNNGYSVSVYKTDWGSGDRRYLKNEEVSSVFHIVTDGNMRTCSKSIIRCE